MSIIAGILREEKGRLEAQLSKYQGKLLQLPNAAIKKRGCYLYHIRRQGKKVLTEYIGKLPGEKAEKAMEQDEERKKCKRRMKETLLELKEVMRLLGKRALSAAGYRVPLNRPGKTNRIVEAEIMQAKSRNPSWGASKLKKLLEGRGETGIPSTSTILDIIRRNTRPRPSKDEYYTAYSDIEKEVPHYKEQFQGKTVLCSCDNPAISKFWAYFRDNFNGLGLKKLICTYYSPGSNAHKAEYKNGQVKKTLLAGSGDFRSEECIGVLQEADIVVTNPPFSLFQDFIGLMAKYGKPFLIIGNRSSVTYKEVFAGIKDGKIWLGATAPKTFTLPSGETTKEIGKICRWFTNLPHKKENPFLELTQTYDPQKYPKYDDFDAIEVSKVMDIPSDYQGLMGVPITFIDKYNPRQFEIIGTLGCHAPNGYALASKIRINGKSIFKRLAIRFKR